MSVIAWFRRCRHGRNRLIKETLTYKREVTDDGETIKKLERKECRCGVVIETQTEHVSLNRTTVSVPPAVAGGQGESL